MGKLDSYDVRKIWGIYNYYILTAACNSFVVVLKEFKTADDYCIFENSSYSI